MRFQSLFPFLLLTYSLTVQAGSPFLTDDPEVDYKQWDFYLYANVMQGKQLALPTWGGYLVNATVLQAPAFEIDWGATENIQLHLIGLYDNYLSHSYYSHSGLGDTTLGIKYRFYHQSTKKLQAALYPQLTIPSGNAVNSLGNGKPWFTIPIWLQKSWDNDWVTYGGGGYAWNSAPGMNNYPYGGLAVQHNFTTKLNLGAELYAQGSTAEFIKTFLLGNIGGIYYFTENFSVLFSGGHSLLGQPYWVGYFGFNFTLPAKKINTLNNP